MKQVIIIHGADSFDSQEKFLEYLKNCEVSRESFLPKTDWKNSLAAELGENFDVLFPRMPNKQNARYAEWKIWFERMLPFMADALILVGHSQGGIFLAKYLAENKLPKKIDRLLLVAAPYKNTRETGDFAIAGPLSGVWEQCQNIHLFYSQDDPVVALGEMEGYKKEWPEAKTHVFSDRGHFKQEQFPELVEEIII